MLKHILINISDKETINSSSSFPTECVCFFDEFEEIIDLIKTKNLLKEEIIIISDSVLIISQAISQHFCTIGYEHNDISFSSLNTSLILNFDGISYSYLDSVLCHHFNKPWTLSDTSELIIIEPTLDDFNSIYQMYFGDAGVKNNYLLDYMNLDYMSEKERFISYINVQFKFYGYGLYNVVHKEKDDIVGQCGLYNDNDNNLCISYYIKPAYRKKNIAYNSCVPIIEYAKTELYAKKIYAHIYDENLASINLAKKLGFEYQAHGLYVLYLNK